MVHVELAQVLHWLAQRACHVVHPHLTHDHALHTPCLKTAADTFAPSLLSREWGACLRLQQGTPSLTQQAWQEACHW